MPYKLDELSPVLSKENVDYHYNVLSAGYVKRFNDGEGDRDFNRGGALLHNLFWAQLQKPKSSNSPVGEVKAFIERHFKTFDEFKEQKENDADKDGEKSTCCGCKLRPFLKIEIYLSSK